jgi:integrase
MRAFRATWSDSANYATKNLERLRSFFRFCQHDEWMTKNPARAVKAPRVKETPTLPFSKTEMERILEACDRYRGDQDRLRAFVLVMRHSGMRIGDTIALDAQRLKGNKLLLYTAKTGTPVYVPLPPVTMKALAKLDTNGSGRFFSTGNAKPQTARELVALSGFTVCAREDRRRALAQVSEYLRGGIAARGGAARNRVDPPGPLVREDHREALQAVGALTAAEARRGSETSLECGLIAHFRGCGANPAPATIFFSR